MPSYTTLARPGAPTYGIIPQADYTIDFLFQDSVDYFFQDGTQKLFDGGTATTQTQQDQVSQHLRT